MAIEQLGLTKTRKPDYQEPRWDIPLNENWEIVAALIETLISGSRWVSGLTYTQGIGLNFTLDDGVINRNLADEDITGGAYQAQNGTTVYVYVNNAGTVVVGNTFDGANILPLWVIQASGGAIVSAGDLRHKLVGGVGGGGGLSWEIITADHTAEPDKGYFVNVTDGAVPVTLTLPLAPEISKSVGINDIKGGASIYQINVEGNGEKIMGAAGPLIINTRWRHLVLTFSDSDDGWRVTTMVDHAYPNQNVYAGLGAPPSDLGRDGDLYFEY